MTCPTWAARRPRTPTSAWSSPTSERAKRAGFSQYNKVSDAKARNLAAAAARGETAAVLRTGVAPRPPPVYERTENPMNIVFVSSEVAPWSKTGGLADVCGSLPRELVKRGHRVMVVSPYYQTGKKEDKHFEGAFDTCSNTSVGCFDGLYEVDPCIRCSTRRRLCVREAQVLRARGRALRR